MKHGWATLIFGLMITSVESHRSYVDANLASLLGSTLDGCTTRIIFDTKKITSEEHFNRLVKTFDSSQSGGPVFIVDKLEPKDDRMTIKTTSGVYWSSDNYTKPTWIVTRNLQCSTQLYFLETKEDLFHSLAYHYVDYHLRKENPDYIIFWEIRKSQLNWSRFLRWPQFFKLYKDYRLYVNFNEKLRKYQAHLIRVFGYYGNRPTMSVETLQATKNTKIHSAWKSFHLQHNRKGSLLCYRCEQYPTYVHYGKLRLKFLLRNYFNMSYSENLRMDFNYHGLFASDWTLEPGSIISTFLPYRSPSFLILPGFLSAQDYKMFTVVKKQLLRRSGWIVILAPFEITIWYGLFPIVTAMVVILRTLSPESVSSCVLSLITPLLVARLEIKRNLPTRYLLLIWAVSCTFVSMVYSAGFAASLSRMWIPIYPTTPEMVDNTTSKIITTSDWIWRNRNEVARMFVGGSYESERIKRLNSAFAAGHCGEGYVKFTLWNKELPALCRYSFKPMNRHEYPMTFVDTWYRTLSMKIAYESSEWFWVSQTTHLSHMQYTYPTFVSNNYFGKLALPLLSQWFAMGLESYWQKIREYGKRKQMHFWNTRIPREDVKSTLLPEQRSIRLESLEPVFTLMYVLVGVAFGILVVERMYFPIGIMPNGLVKEREYKVTNECELQEKSELDNQLENEYSGELKIQSEENIHSPSMIIPSLDLRNQIENGIVNKTSISNVVDGTTKKALLDLQNVAEYQMRSMEVEQEPMHNRRTESATELKNGSLTDLAEEPLNDWKVEPLIDLKEEPLNDLKKQPANQLER